MVEIILGGLSLQVSSSGWFISTDSKTISDYYTPARKEESVGIGPLAT
jgi:hypothetical protein